MWVRRVVLVSFLICLIPSGAASRSGAPYRVGVLYWSMNIPGQVAMRNGLEAEAARLNEEAGKNGASHITLIPRVAGDGAEGVENQIRQMRELVAARPDIIIVQPTNNAALAAPLRQANAAGIPVVAYDQYISGGKLAAYVTSDNHQAGYLDGEYIASRFPGPRKLRLIIVDYPSISSTVERLDGFLDGLRDQGKPFDIVKTYTAVEPVQGARTGESILKDFPLRNSVDVIFTVNDGGGLAVAHVLANAGRDDIAMATIDGDPASIDLVRSDKMIAIDTAQFCGPLGAQALRTAYSILAGQPVAKHILIPVYPVTRETAANYPGWQGPIPQPFRKPWHAKNPDWQGKIIGGR